MLQLCMMIEITQKSEISDITMHCFELLFTECSTRHGDEATSAGGPSECSTESAEECQ